MIILHFEIHILALLVSSYLRASYNRFASAAKSLFSVSSTVGTTNRLVPM